MKEKARKFCEEVDDLNKKYGLSFFIVTEGASMTRNRDCEPVRLARLAVEEWEKSQGLNTKHDWRK